MSATALFCSVVLVVGAVWVFVWAVRQLVHLSGAFKFYGQHRSTYKYLMRNPEVLAQVNLPRTGRYPARGGIGNAVVGGVVGGVVAHHIEEHDSMGEPTEHIDYGYGFDEDTR